MGFLAGVDWSVVGVGALVACAVVTVVGLVVMGMRTSDGRELAIAAGVRLVKLLLGWIEVWLAVRLGQQVRELGAGMIVGDGRLARVREARRLVGEL
jgi:hypothetical protein